MSLKTAGTSMTNSYAFDSPYIAAFAIIDSCTDAKELWRFVDPMLHCPDMHVSQLVEQYYRSSAGETIVHDCENERQQQQSPAGPKARALVKRLGNLTSMFVHDSWTRGLGRERSFRQKAMTTSKWWKLGVESLVKA